MEDYSSSSDDDLSFLPSREIQPYQFEPRASDRPSRQPVMDESDDEDEVEMNDEAGHGVQIQDRRLDNLAWCDCEQCQTMPTNLECICCHEVGPIETILDEVGLTCITEHEGFIGNCLNRYVIQVSLLDHVEMDGPIDDNEPIHELYRHIAYRRFTRWIWFRLGRGRRKVIPACAVKKIRDAFPSEQYTGFRYPRP